MAAHSAFGQLPDAMLKCSPYVIHCLKCHRKPKTELIVILFF